MTTTNTLSIDHSWTLFLDRDGVINRRLKDDYVKHWSEFSFLKGVLETMPFLAQNFGKIIVVTNQQGIGKGLMKADQLDEIHSHMQQAIEDVGGRLDLILYCPELSSENPVCRKPNPGMAYEAKEKFPEIDFNRSIIVGDSITDIQFGENLGMKTIWMRGKEDEYHRLRSLEGKIRIDFRINNFNQLSQILSP